MSLKKLGLLPYLYTRRSVFRIIQPCPWDFNTNNWNIAPEIDNFRHCALVMKIENVN